MSELSDFLKLMAEEKKRKEEERRNSPAGKAIAEVQQRLKQNNEMGDLLEVFVEGKKPGKTVIVEKVVEKEVIKEVVVNKDSFQQPAPQPVDPNIEGIKRKVQFLEQAIGKIAATGPGSGEVNFRWLDDVNRSTMTNANDNWVLEYNAATGKVQFTEDIGPIQTLWFDPNHIDTADDPGLLNWNKQDRTLNLHHPDGVTQQIGQELYYLVKNTTGSTILNGMAVRFGGGTPVDGEARMLAVPFLANGSFSNLYVMGIATQDIASGEEGLVTTFGKVRQLNTTGTPVGETWAVGDILYASPTTAGALTKVKPTSPNNVNPMAAVLKLGVTDGEIFVRPTIEQQSNYAEFVDTTDQTPALINTAYPITFDTTVVARGFRSNGPGLPTSTITCEVSGRYQITAELSLTSTNASAKDIYVWVRKNGANVPLSARRQTLAGNGVYAVLPYALTISLNANDIIELMYATSDVTVIIDSPAATAFSPTIPSVSMLIVQVAQ